MRTESRTADIDIYEKNLEHVQAGGAHVVDGKSAHVQKVVIIPAEDLRPKGRIKFMSGNS